jgi:hypothetical protein
MVGDLRRETGVAQATSLLVQRRVSSGGGLIKTRMVVATSSPRSTRMGPSMIRPEHEARRKIIREWMSLPKDKRQTEQQAKPFAKKATGRIPSSGDPYRQIISWLVRRIGKPEGCLRDHPATFGKRAVLDWDGVDGTSSRRLGIYPGRS